MAELEQPSDRQLVEAALADPEAFGEIVRRHQAFVFGVALRIVGDRQLAEDVAQEALFRAWRALPEFRGEAELRSWLYRIATNLALNAVTRRRDVPVEELPEVASAGAGPYASAERSALRAAVAVAMARLPEEQRIPLELREFQDKSYEEISAELGVPLNTVRTRIFRARRAIASLMEDWR